MPVSFTSNYTIPCSNINVVKKQFYYCRKGVGITDKEVANEMERIKIDDY